MSHKYSYCLGAYTPVFKKGCAHPCLKATLDNLQFFLTTPEWHRGRLDALEKTSSLPAAAVQNSATWSLDVLPTTRPTFSTSASFPAFDYLRLIFSGGISLGAPSEETSAFSQVFHQVLDIAQVFAK